MTIQIADPENRPFDMIQILFEKMNDERRIPYKSQTFLKNQYIYLPNKNADQVYVVKYGQVKIGVHGTDGKEFIKKIAMKGEIFGENILIGQSVRNDYAICMQKTEVYILTINQIQELMRVKQSVNHYIMQLLGERLLDMENRLESLVFKNSRSRIISFLDKLISRRGQRVGYEMLVRHFFTHQEIANFTATSRQTVNMVLNELRNKNILTFNRQRLLVRDMELLKAELDEK